MKAKELPPVELLRELYDYDPDTGILTFKVRRGPCKKGDRAGSGRPDGYRQVRVNGKNYLEHRLIYSLAHGDTISPDYLIDHTNGDVNDNRLVNLRKVTTIANNQNQRLRANNRSGIKGVAFCKQKNKWHARITLNRKDKHLGFFECKEDAILARQRAEIESGFLTRHAECAT